jgi:hypothetical protein
VQEQHDALSALVSAKMEDGDAFSGMVQGLFRHVLRRDGRAILPEGELLEAVAEVLEEAHGADERPSEGWHQLVFKEEGKNIGLLLSLVTRVADLADVSSNDLVGQILWRNRTVSHQRQNVLALHTRAVDDVSWVASEEILTKVRGVFRLFCADAGSAGRMHCREWLKSVHLMTLDPVLCERIQHNVVDRHFYTFAHKDHGDVSTISCDEFLRLIITVAESSHVHPHYCMLAIGCHEDQLRHDVETKGGLAVDYIKQGQKH